MTEIFRQDLREQIHRLTLSHAAAVDKKRLQQKEKKRETEQLFAHTDELKRQIKVWHVVAQCTQHLFHLLFKIMFFFFWIC